MDHIEGYHNSKHKDRIEEVQIDFVALEGTVMPTSKLSYTEEGSDQDQDTGDVEHVQVLSPAGLGGSGCGITGEAEMDQAGTDKEETEENNLNEETD